MFLVQLTMAGFCILSAAALLMLLMDSLLAPATSTTVQHADAATARKPLPAEAV